MKKYYLHNGTESSGPFDIEELKTLKITKKTPVWFEGMERWNTAEKIDELASIFIIVPPALEGFPTTSSSFSNPKVKKKRKETKILGLSKNTFLIVCLTLIILGGITFFKIIKEKRSQELKIKNHKTQIENYQLELKQKELDEQKIQAVIQEKIDSERISREKKGNLSNRILQINQLIAKYQNNLNTTKEDLENASGFKLFRTAEEKKEQMSLLEKNIDFIQNEMYQLKSESDQLKLELEKIP